MAVWSLAMAGVGFVFGAADGLQLYAGPPSLSALDVVLAVGIIYKVVSTYRKITGIDEGDEDED